MAEVVVDIFGYVESYRILQSDGDLFTQAVEAVLPNYRYQRGYYNGHPTRFRTVEYFMFTPN